MSRNYLEDAVLNQKLVAIMSFVNHRELSYVRDIVIFHLRIN